MLDMLGCAKKANFEIQDSAWCKIENTSSICYFSVDRNANYCILRFFKAVEYVICQHLRFLFINFLNFTC
jgi:hypothetical protein